MLSDAIKSSAELYVSDDITERVASRGLVFEKMTKTIAFNYSYAHFSFPQTLKVSWKPKEQLVKCLAVKTDSWWYSNQIIKCTNQPT